MCRVNLSFPLHPFLNAGTVGSWAYVADNHVRDTSKGEDRTTSGQSRYVQGLHAYVQGFTLKACRHDLCRVISPGHPWRLITVIGAPMQLSKGDLAMSKKGVKGGSACAIFNVLLNQEHSIAKLNHFISAAEALIGMDKQASLQFALFDGCREVIGELTQQNETLHASRPLKRGVPTRSKCKKAPCVSKGRAVQ